MSAPPPPPPPAPSATPGDAPGASGAAQAAPPSAPAPPDPGSFDTLHTEVKGMFVLPNNFFEGGKVSFFKGVSENMQVMHSINLGPKTSSYHFAPTYVGTKKISPTQAYPIVMGDIDSEGSMIAQIIHQFSPSISGKLQTQTSGSKFLGAQAEVGRLAIASLDYSGSDYVVGTKLVNVNPAKDSGICIFNYLQKITKNLSLGGEFTYQYGPNIENSAITFGGRYRTDRWVAAASLSPTVGLLHGSYHTKLNEKTQVGTELDINLSHQEVVAHLGFQYNFRESIFRGQISTDGKVAGCLEKHLNPAISLTICGLIDHAEGGASRFGVGFTLGQ